MRSKLMILLLMLIGILTMTACTGTQIEVIPFETEPVNELAQTLPESDISPEQVNTSETELATTVIAESLLSFDAAFFREESAGIELSYPSGWTVSPREVIGERGAQQALLSPGSALEQVADGGARIIFVTYQWDPKNDLNAYITQRKLAWDASGFKTLAEKEFTLDDGREVVIFTMEATEGNQVLFALLTAGEDYLQVSGDGDLSLAMEIIRTIKILD